VNAGLKAGQRGLAIIDIASEKAAIKYVSAVKELREYCSEKPSPKECETQFGVDDAQVAKVCAFGSNHSAGCVSGKAKEMSDAYAKTVEGLSGMTAAWRVLENELSSVKANLKSVKR
jgi:hypothetical protein